MAKTLENGQDKIQQICNALKQETLDPAKKEAEAIIADAHAQAETIIKEAHARSEEMYQEGLKRLEKEKSVFDSALVQGAKQAVETLRQDVETQLFNHELSQLVEKETKDPKVIAKLIDAMVKAIDKEGVEAKLEAVIPQTLNPKEVNALLADNILKSLEGKSVAVGSIEGGAQIKVAGKQMTVVLTDAVVKQLLSRFLRKDFRKILFANVS